MARIQATINMKSRLVESTGESEKEELEESNGKEFTERLEELEKIVVV